MFRGCETFYRGAKRLKLGQIVTRTGAKRLEDGCETAWGGGGQNVYGAKCPGAGPMPEGGWAMGDDYIC